MIETIQVNLYDVPPHLVDLEGGNGIIVNEGSVSLDQEFLQENAQDLGVQPYSANLARLDGNVAAQRSALSINNVDNTSDTNKPVSTATQAAINAAKTAVNVKDYGAVGDGVTSDTAAINSASLACYQSGGGTVVFPQATYAITARSGQNPALLLYPNVSLEGNGCTLLLEGNCTVLGNETNDTVRATITANVAIGAVSLTVDSTAALVAGDMIGIRLGNNAWDSSETKSWHFATVKTIDSSTALTIDTPCPIAMTVASTTAANRAIRRYRQNEIDLLRNMELRNFRIVQGSSGNTELAIWLNQARDVSVKNIYAENPGGSAVGMSYAVNCNVDGLTVPVSIQQGGQPSKGRVINVWNSTNCTYKNVRCEKIQGVVVFVESYCKGIRIENIAYIDNWTEYAGTSHLTSIFFVAQASELHVENATITGEGSGLNIFDSGGSDYKFTYASLSLNTKTRIDSFYLEGWVGGSLNLDGVSTDFSKLKRVSQTIDIPSNASGAGYSPPIAPPNGLLLGIWYSLNDLTGWQTSYITGTGTIVLSSPSLAGERKKLSISYGLAGSPASSGSPVGTRAYSIYTGSVNAGTKLTVEYLYGSTDGDNLSEVQFRDNTATLAAIAAKANLSHTHNASDINAGTLAAARLGSGSSVGMKYLRGDSTWQDIGTAFPKSYLVPISENSGRWLPTHSSPPTITQSGSELASGYNNTLFSDRYNLFGAKFFQGTGFPDGELLFWQGLDSANGLLIGSIEFYTNAPQFDFIVKQSSLNGRILIDDQLAGSFSVAGFPGEYPRFVNLNFGSSQVRKIKIEFPFGFRGIRVPNGSQIWPVDSNSKKRNRCIVIGDSFTEGTGAILFDGFANRLNYATGWEIWQSGSGSTGYLNPGTTGRKKLRDRIHTDVIENNPNIVIVAAGINDGGYGGAQIETEARLLFDTILSGCPGVALVVVGPFYPNTNYSAVANVRTALMSAAAAYNLPFLDPTNPDAPWITESNRNSYHPTVHATATASRTGNAVSSITVTNGGGFYATVPSVSFTGGGGSGATATAVMDGRIKSATVLSGGKGYATAPTVSFVGGGGSGATATATVSGGSVTGITITSEGTGYTSQPRVLLSGPAGSGGAVAVCAICYTVASITVTAGGSGYTSDPTVTIQQAADPTHPTSVGHAYYAERILFALRGFSQ